MVNWINKDDFFDGGNGRVWSPTTAAIKSFATSILNVYCSRRESKRESHFVVVEPSTFSHSNKFVRALRIREKRNDNFLSRCTRPLVKVLKKFCQYKPYILHFLATGIKFRYFYYIHAVIEVCPRHSVHADGSRKPLAETPRPISDGYIVADRIVFKRPVWHPRSETNISRGHKATLPSHWSYDTY